MAGCHIPNGIPEIYEIKIIGNAKTLPNVVETWRPTNSPIYGTIKPSSMPRIYTLLFIDAL